MVSLCALSIAGSACFVVLHYHVKQQKQWDACRVDCDNPQNIAALKRAEPDECPGQYIDNSAEQKNTNDETDSHSYQ